MLWQWLPFRELDLEQLYALLALRQEVFSVGQNCAYLDADGLDQKSWHLLGWKEEGEKRYLSAYLRVVEPGNRYVEHSIGRVCTLARHRREGLGKELTKLALEKTEGQFGPVPIRISAQLYLQKFYEGFGFKALGEVYLEDKIPHIEMLRAP